MSPERLFLIGECLFHLGELRSAAATLEEALRRRPRIPEAHRLLAVIYYDLGAMKQAIAHSFNLATLEPDNGGPHRLIGMISRDYYQVGGAIAAYREALNRRLDPRDRRRDRAATGRVACRSIERTSGVARRVGAVPPGYARQARC